MTPVKKSSRAASAATAALAPKPETPSAAVRSAFVEDTKVRDVLAERLVARGAAAQVFAKRAADAFTAFRPSMFAAGERVRRAYLAPGEDLSQTMRNIVERGAATLRETQDDRSLRIDLSGALGRRATLAAAGPAAAPNKIALEDLVQFLRRRLGRATTLTTDPNRTACEAEARAADVLAKVEGTAPTPTPGAPNPTPAQPAQYQPPAVKPFVGRQVEGLLAKMTAPEDELRYDVRKRATLQDAEEAVDTFELRAGASDVIAYHDFRSLHIAFEHVWEELFDARLGWLGEQLYHEAVKLESYLLPPNTTTLQSSITSIPDLLGLLQDIRALSGRAEDAMPVRASTATGGVSILPPPPGPISGTPSVHTASAVPPGVAWGENGPLTDDGDGATPAGQGVTLIPGAARLSRLLEETERRLRERYAFAVFAKNSYNFGMMVTYRQTWTPERYQVGDLVSTIPLAPRESRKYTTRRVVKKTRAQKEIEESLRTTRSDTSGTSRVEREIVDRAQARTHYDATVQDTFGGEGYKADVTGQVGGDQSTQSEKAKKHFHDAVLKSAEEYRQQHRLEIDTTSSEETEETTTQEIQNPNDELTVTYMFYELQRTYRVREKIHQLTPVILVANEVPAPSAIDDAWLIAHDWILRRVLLDDSFKPALEYLTKSFVGAELNIRILDNNAKAQKQIVDKLNQQITVQTQRLEGDERNLANQVQTYAATQAQAGVVNTVKRIFDPLGITGKEGDGQISSQETMVDYLQETYDRAERERARLLDQLGVATTALQAAIDKLSAATKEHYDRIAEIDRLRIHVKANILYYMQAIWSHEPPDQRFFRIYNLDIEVVEAQTAGVDVPLAAGGIARAAEVLRGRKTADVTITMPPVTTKKKKLVEIADLDEVLGYKGNYAIYALNENNFLTLHMMQDYLEVSDEVTLRDPDDFGNHTVEELQELASCMYKRDRTGFDAYRDDFKKAIIARLTSGRAEDDRVIVPTDSLYIEALVGTHPLLEDFKLIHRSLDVKKVQAETRHAELENVRLAARALRGKDGDPDIEKKIVIEGNGTTVAVQPDE